MTNGVQLLAFDVRATRRAVTVEEVDVTLNTTVQADETLVAPVAKLYRGTTLVGSATVLPNGVVNFDRMETLIERDSTATFTVRVDLNRLAAGTTYSAGTAIGATVASVRGEDAGNNVITATGTAAGNLARLFTVAPSWALVGTPTISQVTVGTGARRDANAQIVVDITALGGDIFIGRNLVTDLALNIDGIIINLVAGDTPTAIADKIRAAINPVGTRTVDVTGTGATLIFTNRVAGIVGNRILPMTDPNYSIGGVIPVITMTGGAELVVSPPAVAIPATATITITTPVMTSPVGIAGALTGDITGAALSPNVTAASITGTDGIAGHIVREGTTRRFTLSGSLSRAGAGAFSGMRIGSIEWSTVDGSGWINSTFGLTPFETGAVLTSGT